jgi:RNA polymerase sigma-70 factor (ECF subfamily)
LAASEEELVGRLKRGEASAYHELVDQYARRLFGLAYTLVGNAADAEDVAQETLLGAVKSIGRFERRSSLWTWLTRIAVRQATKLRRSPAGRRMLSIHAAADSAGDGSNRSAGVASTAEDAMHVPSGVSGVDAKVDLSAALQTLTDEHRAVLVLREFEQMSYEEMSQALDVPIGTIESRLFRARAELRKRLTAYQTD